MPSPTDAFQEAIEQARRKLGCDSPGPAEQGVELCGEKLLEAIAETYRSGQEEAQRSRRQEERDEMLFLQLMHTLPDNVYFKDERSRFICVNQAQANFLGIDSPADAIDKSDFDFFEDENAEGRFEEEQKIIESGEGWTLHEERDLATKDKPVCLVTSKLPLRDRDGRICGTFGISRDITPQFEAERAVERQRKLLETIIEILPCRIFVRDYENRFILVNEAYREALGIDSSEDVIGRELHEFGLPEGAQKVGEQDALVRDHGRSILNHVEFEQGVFSSPRWIVTSKVPLRGPDMSIEGIVGMSYDIDEQKQAEEEARRLGKELQAKNEQFEAELLVARQLQETLMSMGFNAERVYSKYGTSWNAEASYYYKPSHHLAGDFFDLIPISENSFGVLVCDVMGHGVKAALVTMLLRGLILEMPSLLNQPEKVLGQLNNSLCTLAEGPEFPQFTTAVYLTVDLQHGTARLANAGHPTPLLKASEGRDLEAFEPCTVAEIGPALGLIPDEEFACQQFSLGGLTELLFYTDGIIEQTTTSGEEFGLAKLEKILLNQGPNDLIFQLKNIEQAISKNAGSNFFDDDICLVALKLAPKSS